MDTEEELAGALAALLPCSAAARRSFPPSSFPCFAARLRGSGRISRPSSLRRSRLRSRPSFAARSARFAWASASTTHRRSGEIVARAGYTLGIIERVVLPRDVVLVRKLLSELLDADS